MTANNVDFEDKEPGFYSLAPFSSFLMVPNINYLTSCR
jgi:hypothetical protein